MQLTGRVLKSFKTWLGDGISKTWKSISNYFSNLFCNKKGSNRIQDALDKLSPKDKSHILDPSHHWNRLVPNPGDPNNWDKVAAIIIKVMTDGTWQAYGRTQSADSKVLTIGGWLVKVTYKVVNGSLRIFDTWVVPK